MGLAKKHTAQIEIPGEPGQWMRLRSLTHIEDADAHAVKTAASIALMRDLDGVTVPIPATPPAPDPLAGHDVPTVLAGITEWSYEGEVDAAELDPQTAEWAAREIVRLTHPSEVELGKDSSRSTAISEDPVPLRRSG